jgi:hypothetical protein
MNFIARTGARTDDDVHPSVAAPVRITVKSGDAHRTAMRTLTVTVRRVGVVGAHPLSS